jgi:hypothetical protein
MFAVADLHRVTIIQPTSAHSRSKAIGLHPAKVDIRASTGALQAEGGENEVRRLGKAGARRSFHCRAQDG